jgi:hypothetical protein
MCAGHQILSSIYIQRAKNKTSVLILGSTSISIIRLDCGYRLSWCNLKIPKFFSLANHLATIDQLDIAVSNPMPAKVTLVSP